MRWKLSKDKLRAETAANQSPPAEPSSEPELTAAAPADTTPSEAVHLNSLPREAEEALTIDAPFDLADTQPAFPEAALPLDKPQPSVFAMGTEAEAPVFAMGTDTASDDSPAFDPLNFALASDLDSVGTFDTNSADNASIFAINDLETAVNQTDSGEGDAPVFGLDSVFMPEEGDEAPLFAPLSSAFDPLPDEAADALVLPTHDQEPIILGGGTGFTPMPLGGESDAEPIALGGEAGATFGAFAPYQPENEEPDGGVLAMGTAGDDAYSDPEPEVGAMAFDPQSPAVGMFNPNAPTAGEEIVQETTAPDFADPADTSPLAFEPAFEAPEALTGEALPNMPDDGDEPFMDREALAAGLVTMEATTGLPRVAPFVLPGENNLAFGDSEDGPHSLTLRLGSLSATYPLAKPVTTIGRPDRDTATYPDIEVDLDDGVSRRHAEVRQENGLAYLVDVGSTNGTILNGELLTPNQPARLMHGDRIRIGERVEIVFE